MEIKCPTCGLERTVDAASAEHAEEQMCDPCAASYKALLAEIEARAAERQADDATAAHVEAPALMASANDGDAEAQTLGFASGAGGGQEESDSDGYALGVSLYRVPAAGLAVCAAGLFAVLFFTGWLRPAGAAQTASATESAAAAQSAGVQEVGAPEAVDKVGDDSTSTPAEAELATVSETADDEPAAAVEVASDDASATEEIDEAQFEKEELAAEGGDKAQPAPAPAPEPAKVADAEGRFTIQVGSFNQSGEAEARASVLRAAGFDARVAAVEIPKKGTWYRVQSGRFQTREQAALYEKSLRASGGAENSFVAESAN